MSRFTIAPRPVLAALVIAGAGLAGCAQPSGTQIVLLGQSTSGGQVAAQQVNRFIANAEAAGCNAISVGGYAAAEDGVIIGIPVLVECPQGTRLGPDGQPAP